MNSKEKNFVLSMRKIKINRKKGILFWITGFPGSGKTVIAKKIKPSIVKLYGPTILISGDDMRKIFNLKKYSRSARLKNGLMFNKYCKFVTNQNINVIFAVVGLFNKVRKKNKLNIQNYVEIYIKSELKKIIKAGKKKIYKRFDKNIVGKDIKPELPLSPNIIINNKFDKTVNELSYELIKKIRNIIL